MKECAPFWVEPSPPQLTRVNPSVAQARIEKRVFFIIRIYIKRYGHNGH